MTVRGVRWPGMQSRTRAGPGPVPVSDVSPYGESYFSSQTCARPALLSMLCSNTFGRAWLGTVPCAPTESSNS
jgi:hypothetical protein